jgi:thiol:disulfide interchange protein
MGAAAYSGIESEVVQTEQVRAELVAHAPDGVDPGKTIWVGLQITHQPEWHTYWKNPGDSGLATQLQWTLPPGVTAGEVAWPTPKKIPIGTLTNFGYEGTVLLPVPLTVSSSFVPPFLARDLEIHLTASWLVCRLECVPQDGNFVLKVPLKGSTASRGADFEAARLASPTAFAGSAQAQVSAKGILLTVSALPAAWQGKALNAFPETPELTEPSHTPDAKDRVAGETASSPGTQSWQQGTWSAWLPLSALRSASPTTVPVVLALGGTSVRLETPVTGTWPTMAGQVAPAARTAALPSPAPAPSTPGNYALALAAALLGGLILNLMPCVFPVLAIKMLAFVGQGSSTRRAHRAQGLAYTAGVVVSFMALGGLMLALRAGGEQLGWGFQLQSPAVITGLAVLFTLLGLNLAGVFEFGHWLPSPIAALQLRHPVVDSALSGVLAVAVASPCTAPFMGASLGLAIALPAGQALGVFAALGLGLALPYLVASWVPGVGRWLPRPGAWMDALRRFMAFFMWATVVWLVWVLGHLSGVDGGASLLALLLALSLVVWSLSLPGRSRWGFTLFSIAAFAFLMLAIGPNVLKMQPPGDATTTMAGNADGAASSRTWQAWAPGRVDAELAAGKAVFVDFTAAWCITCQYNKKTTLSHPDVLAAFKSQNVSLLRADWTRRDPAITQALEQLGRSGVPVYVVYRAGQAPRVLSEILSVEEVRAALGAV